MAATLLSLVIDTAYPPRCPGCDRPHAWEACGRAREPSGPQDVFCAMCSWLVRGLQQVCPRCAQIHPPYLDHPSQQGLCDRCHSSPPPWAWAHCGFELTAPMQSAIMRGKLPGGAWACHAVTAAMTPSLSIDLSDALLIPVPLHPGVESRRGFNQAREIAMAIASVTGSQVVPGLRRIRRGAPQKRLGAGARQMNVERVFCAAPGFAPAGRTIVLVDDVVTTTHTLRSAARALRAAGHPVHGIVGLAREP